MAGRKVYFYRVFVGRDDNLRPLSFNARAALGELGQLEFIDDDTGRYLDFADGDLACCWVDQIRAPQHVRIARSRRTHLPPVERGGELEDLDLPEDAGLAEESFLVFFENDIVGCIYSSFSPRVSVMRRYLRERCGEDYRAISFDPLLRQDVADKLEKLQEVRTVELRVSPSYAAQVEQASPSLASAIRELSELGDPQQVAITLKPAPYSRGWLSDNIFEPIKRLSRREDLREGVDTFKVKGLDGETGKLDEIDLLKDQLVLYMDVDLAEGRSASLSRPAAYRAIEDAYRQLRPHLETAAGVI